MLSLLSPLLCIGQQEKIIDIKYSDRSVRGIKGLCSRDAAVVSAIALNNYFLQLLWRIRNRYY